MKALLEILTKAKGPVSMVELMKMTKLNKNRLGHTLRRLMSANKIRKEGPKKGYNVRYVLT